MGASKLRTFFKVTFPMLIPGFASSFLLLFVEASADLANPLVIGGDLSVERLQLAYRSGIFPWFNEDEPILWWSPPERMVVVPSMYKVSKSQSYAGT